MCSPVQMQCTRPSSDQFLRSKSHLSLKKSRQDLLQRTEMRMLRWMMGIKRIEKTRKDVRTRTGVRRVIQNDMKETELINWL